jgi:hypothetical protein
MKEFVNPKMIVREMAGRTIWGLCGPHRKIAILSALGF